MTASKPSISRLWQQYRSAPLSQQFVYEWIAFGVLCVVWALVVLILAVML